MLVALRIIGLAVVIALAVVVLAWSFTGDRRWLRLAWQIVRYSAFGLAFVLLLFAAQALLESR